MFPQLSSTFMQNDRLLNTCKTYLHMRLQKLKQKHFLQDKNPPYDIKNIYLWPGIIYEFQHSFLKELCFDLKQLSCTDAFSKLK